MLVFAKEKLVFLAMPKTGTTALETALEPKAAVVLRQMPNLKHTPAFRYDRYLREYMGKCGLEDLQTLCVLRHPVEWLGSWYRYRSRPSKDGAYNSTKHMTFDSFVAEYAAERPAKWAQVGDPARFIRDNNRTMMVDHLFQYEQMDLLIAFLEDRFRSKIDLPRLNVSPLKDMELAVGTLRALEARHPQMFDDWEAARR